MSYEPVGWLEGAAGSLHAPQDRRVLSRRLPSSLKLYTLRGVSAVYDGCNVNPEFTDSFLALLVRPGETGVVCRYEHTQSNEHKRLRTKFAGLS